ncbi:MAG: hypothetical protein IKJ41_03210 [Clostridia bacterium]|nr:hypothetical protein [Clostridia bacterium]
MSVQKIQDTLNSCENALCDAKRKFDSGNRLIQSKVSRSIDLFGGTATSQVSEIAADCRRLCDNLYATCQTHVAILNETCRPLLEDSIPITSVESIWKMICKLNEESEITNNFTASLNSKNMGDVATVQYHPTIESKMIESYWEAKYKNWPGREKYEQELQDAKIKKEKEKKEAADKKKNSDETAYAEALAEWNEIAEKTEKKRQAAIKEKEEQERELTIRKIEANLEMVINDQEKIKQECTEKLEETKTLMAGLRFYQILDKKKCQKAINDLTARVNSAEQTIIQARQKHDEDLQQLDKIVKRGMSKVKASIIKKYPLPRKPRIPLSMRFSDVSPVQLVNEAMKTDIIDTLVKNGELTCSELQKKCPSLGDLTLARIKNWVDELEREGEIKRKEKKVDGYKQTVYTLAY